MTPRAALLVALLTEAVPRTATEPASTKLRLELRAPGACTSRTDLAARIAVRSSHIEVVEDAPISAHVDVVSPRPGSVVADLVLARRGVEQAPRRVVARSCAEAADGVALIIAVTLDPSSRSKPAPLLETSAATGSGEDRAGSPVAKSAQPAATPAAATLPTPPTAELTGEAPETRMSKGRHRGELAGSVAAQTVFGPAPGVMPGIGIYLLAGLDRDGLWAPALVLGGTHVWRSDLAEVGGTASFTLDAASLDACPLRLRWWRLVARPCASALLGRLATQGSNTTAAAGASRPFGTAGAVISAGFGAPIEVTARLGISVTLLRDVYEFANDVFYRTTAITISASVGVGVHWP